MGPESSDLRATRSRPAVDITNKRSHTVTPSKSPASATASTMYEQKHSSATKQIEVHACWPPEAGTLPPLYIASLLLATALPIF
eukprot:717313-Pyramimonas_sp.AAC.2